MRYVKFLVLLLVFVVSMLFFVQNNQSLSTAVVLEFNVLALHLYSLPLPVYLLVLAGFCLGALFCLAFLLIDRIRLGFELKSLRTRYATLEDEVLSLRTIPLNQSQNQLHTPAGQSTPGQ